jgi:hypothetical protein
MIGLGRGIFRTENLDRYLSRKFNKLMLQKRQSVQPDVHASPEANQPKPMVAKPSAGSWLPDVPTTQNSGEGQGGTPPQNGSLNDRAQNGRMMGSFIWVESIEQSGTTRFGQN